jgi:uncharacterized protein YybS (DUF2232 family)
MERMPADLSPADRKTALAAFDKVGERSLSMAERFWPSMVLAGLMSQTAIFLLAGWGLARLAVAAPPRPRLTPLALWRAPFATVWVLIGGLVLVLLTATGLAGLIGWNLVVLAATLLIIQGLGVQTWLVARVLPRAGLGAFFLAPAMIGGGALIGLADQWMDLRRLRRPPDSDDET